MERGREGCYIGNVPSGRWDVSSTISHVRWLRGAAVPGHLYSHFSPIKNIAIHLLHRVLRVPLVVEPHERKPTRFLREAVPWRVDITHLAITLEYRQQVLGSDAVRKVVHFQAYHSLYVGRASIPETRGVTTPLSTSATTSVAFSALTATPSVPVAHFSTLPTLRLLNRRPNVPLKPPH